MGLRFVKKNSNMYQFVNATWNPITGRCEHDCKYCYMKGWGELPPLKLKEKELRTDLGKGNFIFVGSGTDMFAENVSPTWLFTVLSKCNQYDNKYLFQTKNPFKIWSWIKGHGMPKNSIIGTTIETNRDTTDISLAPLPSERVNFMTKIDLPKMVTIEPVMKFDLEELVTMIRTIKPEWANIGADSKNYKLPEPTWEEVQNLIYRLKEFTEVKLKKNLFRLKK